MKKKIFLVDDHPIIRRGYRAIIGNEADLEVCGEASNGLEALERISDVKPDLVIVDISLSGMSGIELIKHIRSRTPHPRILVISMYDEALYAERAIHAGAGGYLMKCEPDTSVLRAIRSVLRGSLYLSEHMNNKVLRRVSSRSDERPVSAIERLGDRELEVFTLIGRGLTTKAIADAMGISAKTVESHRARIRAKLNVDSTEELRQRAILWVHRKPE